VARLLAIFEQELGDKPYVLGERVSLVDFHLASIFQWMVFCGIDVAPYPKSAAWAARCAERPALAKLRAQ
jgi:glutathione S-transferase